MLRQSFNTGWEVVPNEEMISFVKAPGEPVVLPYDDMTRHGRTQDALSQSHTGYFPDVMCTLTKKFNVPVDWEGKSVLLEFEGVYSNSMVYINSDYAGGCPHGYTNFYIDADRFLLYGRENEVKVIAKTCRDSRWYTGVGLYRSVKLLVGGTVHIIPDSYRITTSEADDTGALIEVALTLDNKGTTTVATRIVTKLIDTDGITVTEGVSVVTAFPHEQETLRQRLYINSPHRWDIDNPYLYTAKTEVYAGDTLIDEETSSYGIRTLSLDVHNGLRINGKTVKLRGACVHHDNGIIGAATIARAEERRVELLKKAGFNAIRSAHNPISKAFLDACDKHGMVVMDELTDMWTRRKTDFDYSASFPHHWKQAVQAMVAKDYNHPSVIMYSIGNEIPETGSPNGAFMGRKLAEEIRSLDSTRYVTNCINFMLSMLYKLEIPEQSAQENKASEINELMTNFGAMQDRLTVSEAASECTAESFDALDISGYNYATIRYESDKDLYPNRVICGSETFPKQIADNWKVVQENSHVIGDFTWTGWDYLGEAGIGKMEYKEDGAAPGFYGQYPWYIAFCGDYDIIGCRRPVSYYREIVFGLRKEPYIAVRNPKNYGKTLLSNKWDFIDGLSSWTWDGFEGKPVEIEVYADADCVELLCNGVKVGESEVCQCKAVITTTYQPGELVAVAKCNGFETGCTSLTTAKQGLQLCINADRNEIRADDTDLSYIMISLTDEDGVVNHSVDRTISVSVEGTGFLLGLGSANPKSEQNFRQNSGTTFNGYALAVIRPTCVGNIFVTIEADGCDTKTLSIKVI